MNTVTLASVAAVVGSRLQGRNYVALGDDELSEELRRVARNFRRIPTVSDYDGLVVMFVRGGLNFKVDGRKAGPCQNGWQGLEKVKLSSDFRTKEALVFWKPRLVKGSFLKKPDEQKARLAEIRSGLELPDGFLTFGDASLLAQLIHGHCALISGERIPLNGDWARTDTYGEGGSICLGGHDEHGLDYNQFPDDDQGEPIGVFPIGVLGLG